MSLEIVEKTGTEGIATLFVARAPSGRFIEFVESFQPNQPIEKKWVLVLSVMHGCPVQCLMCDAGKAFGGNLSREEMLGQVDYLVRRRFPDGKVPTQKFKVQFTRVGEPAFNDHVLEVLEALPSEYDAPGLIPSVSTVAPRGREKFFDRLLAIKQKHYRNGRFQLQFSIHTTDAEKRARLIPAPKWGFEEIAAYGRRFHEEGDRKITLNFALMDGYPVEPKVVAEHFDPSTFLVKITPLNPTKKARANKLTPAFDPCESNPVQPLVDEFKRLGFDVLVSIGELEENRIGSNCGQFVGAYSGQAAPPR